MPSLGSVLAEAVAAARYGVVPEPELMEAIRAGRPVSFGTLGFDSLATMEFCISVEVQTGVALTPEVMDGFESMEDVARWLSARV